MKETESVSVVREHSLGECRKKRMTATGTLKASDGM